MTSGHEPWQPGSGDAAAFNGLARRVLGGGADDVVWEQSDGAAGDHCRFEAADGTLVITAPDALGAAVALHGYLRRALGRRVCWDTVLPLGDGTLPDCAATTIERVRRPAYYLNFCTFGYTTTFWDWDRWEREIDWMALHGISMPLAAVGHEAVLAEVYRTAGLDDDEIGEFLGSPSYLPWQLMGCLDSWGGPLSTSWLDQRRQLGARIIERQRAFGMTPVLPAFVGHVPASLARHDTTVRTWAGFPTRLLDPDDPRFIELAGAVASTQREWFGTSHLYAADPFIEMEPPDDDPGYLPRIAATVLDGLRAGDPDAVWVMQAWTFDFLDWWTDARVAELLDAVADDRLLLLDLWGEHSPQWTRFDGFRGKPWIWCALHNFGGRSDLFGNLPTLAANLHAAMTASEPPIGVGLAMEATEQNHVVYELTLEPDPPTPARLDGWVATFAAERYGSDDPSLAAAWRLLLDTVYSAPAAAVQPNVPPSTVKMRPDLDLLGGAGRDRLAGFAWFDAERLLEAWRLLLDVAERRPDLVAGELGHDLTAIAATAMCRAADRLVAAVVDAREAPGGDVTAAGAELLALLAALDGVIDQRPEFRLATWEAGARRAADSSVDETRLVEGARRLISAWIEPHSTLDDYAGRLWSGVVGGLYRERWRVWVEVVAAARADGTEPGAEQLDARLDAVTAAFITGDSPSPPPSATDDPFEVLRHALDRCTDLLTGRNAP